MPGVPTPDRDQGRCHAALLLSRCRSARICCAEYRARHAAVWPDMLHALRDSGWRNYSIFAAPDGTLVGYVEADDLAAAQQAMAATEVNARWQAEMSRFFVGLDGLPAGRGIRTARARSSTWTISWPRLQDDGKRA